MSFDSRLIHTVAIERPYQQVAALLPQQDEYGQPVTEYVSVTEEVACFINPNRSREVVAVSDGGPIVNLHTIFFPIDVDVRGIDRLHNVDTGELHEVRGTKSFRFGRSPHHEVETNLVASAAVPVEA